MSKADEVSQILGAIADILEWDSMARGEGSGANDNRTVYQAIANLLGERASDIATEYARSIAGAINEHKSFRRGHTMQRTYVIELNVEFTDREKYGIIEQTVREAAQQVAAFAAILADKGQPRIGVRYDDRFEGQVDIDISGHQGGRLDDA